MKLAAVLLAGGWAALAGSLGAATTGIRIDQTVEGQFPAVLSFSPIISGEARVVINVDSDGRLADWLVTGYTHEAFAQEAIQLLRHWRYTPAAIDGRPIDARMEVTLRFSSRGRVVSLSREDTPAMLMNDFLRNQFVRRVCPAADLDRPIAVVQAVNPPDPGRTEAAPASAPVSVLLDFYVDENGQTRMPVVLNDAQEDYARAAVWALSQWRFAAPTHAGKTVAVRVRQEFIFHGQPAAPAPDGTRT